MQRSEKMMTTNERKRIRNHANRNITKILDALGVRYEARGSLIQAICPCHQHGGDGDNPTAFSWRTDIGYWICWTHHCNDAYGNDIFGLIRSVKECSFNESVEWLNNFMLQKNIDLDLDAPEPVNRSRAGKIHVHEPLDESNLKWLKPRPQFLLDRGFSAEVLDDYQIGMWERLGTYMHDRIVIPLRDHEDYLVGYTGRTIHDKEWFKERGKTYAKWVHARRYDRFPKKGELSTSSLLFNLNRAKQYIQPNRRLILVEGPLDGLKLEMAGIHNWVASLSTAFGATHRTLLVNAGVTDLCVAYDNDIKKDPNKLNPGEKAWGRIQKLVGDLFNLERIPLPVGRDPGSMDVDEVLATFATYSQ